MNIAISQERGPLGKAGKAGQAEGWGLAGGALAEASWSLRVEGKKLALVLERAELPQGARIERLVMALPHVPFPFDFKGGVGRFRHHRGVAEEVVLGFDARVVLDWLNRSSGGRISGSAVDDQLILSGKTGETRWTMRGRLIADPEADPTGGAPSLQISLYEIRAFGPTSEPWPVLAKEVLDLLPEAWVIERQLTTARVRLLGPALAWALSGLGWKLPSLRALEARGVELRQGRFMVHFVARGTAAPMVEAVIGAQGTPGTVGGGSELAGWQPQFERFIEDLEIKRHHGQIDRLLEQGLVREAMAEAYRALDGEVRPGFLAERLIGMTASQPILYDECERLCREVLKQSADWVPALVGLVVVALGRGRDEEAVAQLERLVLALARRSHREDATAADMTLAAIYREMAPEEGERALQRVLERAPDHEEALTELIHLAELRGDGRQARPLYKRLLFVARSQEKTREAGLRLAQIALREGEMEDARVLLKVVLEAVPDDLEALMALAEVERQEGHGWKAQKILEDALKGVAPSDERVLAEILAALATLLLDTLADPARARRTLWRAGDLRKVQGAQAHRLAALALRASDAVLARRFAEWVGEGDEAWVDAQVVAAQAELNQGKVQEPLTRVLAILKREPDHEGALALLDAVAPSAARKQWLVHELHRASARVPAGAPRARIADRVAKLYASLDLPWDEMGPLREAVFGDVDGAQFEARARRLMALQRRFGLWADYQEVGRVWLARLEAGDGEIEAAEVRSELLYELGKVALEALGDAEEAYRFLREATELRPRDVEAQELLAKTLEGLLGARGFDGEKVELLVATYHRLESLRAGEVGRDAARVRLAEIFFYALKQPAPSRACLSRVQGPMTPAIEALEAALGAGGGEAQVAWLEGAGGAAEPVGLDVGVGAQEADVQEDGRMAEAIAAADRGELHEAIGYLDALLRERPEDRAAQELVALLVEQVMEAELPEVPMAQSWVDEAAVLEGAGEAASRQDGWGAALAAGGDGWAAAEEEAEDVAAEEETGWGAGVAAQVEAGETVDMLLERASQHYLQGELVAAREDLEALVALDPDIPAALELYQEVLGALGESRARAEVLEELVERIFDLGAVARYLTLLAQTWEMVGEEAKAQRVWVRALVLDPLMEPQFGMSVMALEALGAAGLEDRVRLWEARAEALEHVEGDAGEIAMARAEAAAAREAMQGGEG